MPIPKSLIKLNDCIAWIPTIRGCLSLDLIDDAKGILGDVDKYSIRFKRIDRFRSEHYIIASSLHTVNDSKVGEDYIRTFRYFFTGSINNETINQKFLKESNLANDEDLKEYIDENGLLIGHLAIVAEETYRLSDLEVSFLNEIQELTKYNEKYNKQFNVEAASMGILQATRNDMFAIWQNLKDLAQQIEAEKKRPTFSFDVILTRDGILLLKDVTAQEFRNYYAEVGTPDDYTKNIPLHRIFKIAMNYIKYLFHSNYHHNEDHDTYLPSSNLHPLIQGDNLNLYPVFRHQLDAFLFPVIKLKRSAFSSYTVDPKGIILYTKAFIKVFENNNLVNLKETKKADDFCAILQNEIQEMTSKHSVLVNAAISQHNKFLVLSGLLAFLFTCLKLLSIFLKFPQVELKPVINKFDFSSVDTNFILFDLGVIGFFTILGYSIYYYSRSSVLKKQFKLKPRKKNILFRNSNLVHKRFSYAYQFYIKNNTIKLKIGEMKIWILLSIIYFLGFLLIAIILVILFYISL